MLEPPTQIPHGSRELGFDAVAPAARRRRVVGLVQDQETSRKHRSEPFSHRVGVGRIDEQIVTRKRLCVRQGLTPKPRSRRTRAR